MESSNVYFPVIMEIHLIIAYYISNKLRKNLNFCRSFYLRRIVQTKMREKFSHNLCHRFLSQQLNLNRETSPTKRFIKQMNQMTVKNE